ncbi:MAG TPA: hypothetical protein VFL73_02925, partial [Solirubrobacteraceae bacterium]|nr:hypothetical protein [Solirubrobacteraceae bacterium]
MIRPRCGRPALTRTQRRTMRDLRRELDQLERAITGLEQRMLSEEPLRLARDQRRELVDYLANEGLSTRAIAPIVGITKSEAHRDLQVSRRGTPDPQPLVNTETGEVSDDYQ